MIQPNPKKKIVKKKSPHPNDDYKDMVDPATGKKGTMGGEGTTPPFGGPGPKKGTKVYDIGTGRYETVKKNGGPVKKVVKKAKTGTKVKKATMGAMASPMMKKGGSMKKCKYGCK